MQTQKPEWFTQRKIKISCRWARRQKSGAGRRPVFEDLVKNDEDRAMVRLVSATFDLNRPYMAPPGVPPERLEALRMAFDAMAKDPAFIAVANKYTNVAPSTGEELESAVAEVYATPQAVVERMMALQSLSG